jgi:mRNA interferase HicA
MKRRDLLRRIAEIAKAQDAEAIFTEGANHTKVTIGDRRTVIPRHNEVKEPLARKIIRDLEED